MILGDIMDVVPPNYVTPRRPVAARVEHANVTVERTDVVDLVQFQDVLVAAV